MVKFLRKHITGNEVSGRTTTVKKEIFFSFIIKIISVLVGVLLVPMLIDLLDKERYGVWLTLSSIFAWFSFFDIGIGNGMRNKLAEALAMDNKKLAKEYVSTTFALVGSIFVFIIIVFEIINPFLNWRTILNAKTITANELYLLTSVVFSLFLFRFIFQLIGVVYIANHKPSVNNGLVTLGSFLSFLCITAIYLFNTGGNVSLVTLGILLVGIPLFVLIVATIWTFIGPYKFLRPEISCIKIKHAKGLLSLGMQFFLIQIAAILLFSSANILIVQLFNPNEVVVYNSALIFFQLPIMVFGIIMTPIWSAVTDAYTKQDLEWLKQTLKRLNKISMAFTLVIIVMTLVSPFIYKIWLGDRIQIPFLLSCSMGFFAIINVFLAPYTNFINGIGKMKVSTYIVLSTFILYIPLAIFLCKVFDSSSGVIIATCLLNATGLYFQPYQVYKLLNGKANGIWNK